jgi:hypothetical protein
VKPTALRLVFLLLLPSCIQPVNATKDYTLFAEKTARIGVPMVSWTVGSRYWRFGNDILDIGDTNKYGSGTQLPLHRELLYSGLDGNTVRVAYREYISGYSRGDFRQDLTFNIADSSVTFENLELRVLKADSKSITFIVTAEHSDFAPSISRPAQ